MNHIDTKKFTYNNTVLYIDYNKTDKSITLSYFIDDYLESKQDFDSIEQLLTHLRDIRLDNAVNWKLKDYLKDITVHIHTLNN